MGRKASGLNPFTVDMTAELPGDGASSVSRISHGYIQEVQE